MDGLSREHTVLTFEFEGYFFKQTVRLTVSENMREPRGGQGVSVLIRTRDLESRLHELLWMLSRQTLQPSELVVVDNFSSKEALEKMRDVLLKAKRGFFGGEVIVKLVPIADEDFSHPYSTNLGVYVASGSLVCITNGHSVPTSEVWLERGVAHFKKREVAGVGGYFLPHDDGNVWEKIGYGWTWTRFNEVAKVYLRDDHFSTINCIIRRTLWEEYPFDENLPKEVPQAEKFGGEDYDWAVEMLARGYEIILEPEFKVYHSHSETLPQLVFKYLVWREIRKRIRVFKRPRRSYTRVGLARPLYYNL